MPCELIPAPLRREVIDRAGGMCEYCQFPAGYSNAPYHCDHIDPRSAGGTTTTGNLAWVCPACNSHKYAKVEARDPQTGQMTALFHPRRQRWQQHFRWSEDGRVILGQSAEGRATIDALQLNRLELLNLRKLLVITGEHPRGQE